MIRSALTTLSITTPLSGSIPVGISTATLNPFELFICSIIAAIGSFNFPITPVPRIASIIISKSSKSMSSAFVMN